MSQHGMTQENVKTGIQVKRPEVFIQKEAAEMMDRLGAKFGLTSSDRTRIRVEKPKSSASEEFLFGARQPS